MTPLRRAHKFGAIATEVDGVRFASRKESRRYQELKLLEKAGEIHGLMLQPGFPLLVPGRGNGGPYERVLVGHYLADFVYCACRGKKCDRSQLVVEDVKGFKTPLYKLKKKMVEAIYSVVITEV